MNLLVILLVLGLRQTGLATEPAAMVSGLMRSWRDSWLQRGQREGWNGAIVLGLLVLPPVLLVAVALSFLNGFWHTLVAAGVALLVMLIVLLDRRLPATLDREQEAWLASDDEHRLVLAQTDLNTLEAAAEIELARARRELLAEQLQELFSPLFWFLALGPVAAFTYYFLRLAAAVEGQPAGDVARSLLRYADWPVARVLALSFALAGDFVATWQHWRGQVLDTTVPAIDLLDDSATAAQPVSLRMRADTGPGEVLGEGLTLIGALLQRALVIWIVLLALHTLWP
jgi:membrane protein required for beta-lactamase induction